MKIFLKKYIYIYVKICEDSPIIIIVIQIDYSTVRQSLQKKSI